MSYLYLIEIKKFSREIFASVGLIIYGNSDFDLSKEIPSFGARDLDNDGYLTMENSRSSMLMKKRRLPSSIQMDFH